MSNDLMTLFLPVLGRPLEPGFNVFDVMHHGLHEKQISNVFQWLLEAEGSHGLGDRFIRVFLNEVNRGMPGQEPLAHAEFWVRQEVNTSLPGKVADIADLVLESNAAVIVIENYFTSDGHGHDYYQYLHYSQRDGRRGVVALLCRDVESSLQTLGWENAPVLTYRSLLDRLHNELRDDQSYQQQNPEAYSFIEQMGRKFVKGNARMEDHDVLGFITAMCHTGEALRYQGLRQDVAADKFANDLAEQARHRFGEGRELLKRLKGRLKDFCGGPLRQQLNATLGSEFLQGVGVSYAGIYQWTIDLIFASNVAGADASRIQLKFGPTAWFANEQDPDWKRTVDPAVADYSRLFLTHGPLKEIRQSVVTLQEVLDGLDPTDLRLHDEIVRLVGEPDGYA